MISFACPSCRKDIGTDNSMGGIRVPCPGCNTTLLIPFSKAVSKGGVPTSQTYAESRPSAEETVENPNEGWIQDVERCSKSGARRFEGDRNCRFCREKFPASAGFVKAISGAASSASKSRRGKAILKLVFLAAWLVGAGTSLIWALGPSGPAEIPAEDLCQGNIRSLYDALQRLEVEGEGIPKTLGADFWREVVDKQSVSAAVSCPLAERAGLNHRVYYRGPAKVWSDLAETSIVLADPVTGHADGTTILLKNGEIRFAPKGSSEYARALVETRE